MTEELCGVFKKVHLWIFKVHSYKRWISSAFSHTKGACV